MRRDVTEGHLSWPETKLAVLLEQAFRIGEELALDLRSIQGSSQVEAVSQKLLENHVVTMTHIVKQLSHDTKVYTRWRRASFFFFLKVKSLTWINCYASV